jgi:hypothetical protein
MTVGAHHGAKRGGERSQVPAGTPRREGRLRPRLEVRHLRLRQRQLGPLRERLRNSGSFLDIGSHLFYVAKPFPEEVTDVFDSLCDGGSSYGESSNLGAMVEVMALGEDEGGDSPRPECPSPERLLP